MTLGTISIILTVAGAGISLVSSLVDKKKREQDIAEAVKKYINDLKIDKEL